MNPSDLVIEYLPVADLPPATRNPKRHATAALRSSVERFGFAEPVVIDGRTGRLVSGHGRREVLLELEAAGGAPPRGVRLGADGRWLVPVVRGWTSADDAEAEAFLVTVNRTVEAGGWDELGLGAILRDAAARVDFTTLGFDRSKLDALIRGAGGAVAKLRDPLPIPPEPKEPKTKPGDLYVLGNHRLLCGDSTKAEDVARLLDGARASLVFTDPPYAIYGSSSGLSADVTDDKIVRPFFRDVLAAAQRSTDTFAHVYVCCDWRSWPSWWEVAKQTALAPKNLIVWDKGGAGLGNNFANTHELVGFFVNMPQQQVMAKARPTGMRPVHAPNIVRFDRARGEDREHNAAKPVELVERFLELGSDAGALVLDLFAGSGTTLIAAERKGRRCATIEIQPSWCDVTVARWERETGQKAERVPAK